jgi:hypothetical protein
MQDWKVELTLNGEREISKKVLLKKIKNFLKDLEFGVDDSKKKENKLIISTENLKNYPQDNSKKQVKCLVCKTYFSLEECLFGEKSDMPIKNFLKVCSDCRIHNLVPPEERHKS